MGSKYSVLHVSPILYYFQDSTEAGSRTGNSNNNFPLLAHSNVVHQTDTVDNIRSPATPKEKRCPPAMGTRKKSSSKFITAVQHSHLRQQLQAEHFSDETINLLIDGTSDSVLWNRSSAKTKWEDICSQWNIDPTRPDLPDLADFFTSLFRDKQLKISTIRQLRSGLKLALHKDHQELLFHPCMNRLLNSMSRLKPVVPKLGDDVWDIEVVLKYLEEKFPENENLSLINLSHKCVTLILLSTMCRQQNLQLMETD